MNIPFIDLAAQQRIIRPGIDAAIDRVLHHGGYVMGPEVRELEAQLADFCGAKHALSCANGTDALQLAVMALGAGTGDAVFCPSFTFIATAEILPFFGATPYFVDIDPKTYNMDSESLKRAITAARTAGLVPRGVIPVDLFGLPADHHAIEEIARAEGMWIIEDAAQGFGGRIGTKVAGTFGDIATTSFFPAKPLGCYGDGGALFTENDETAALIDSYRIHGKGQDKYDNERIGINSRLDTLQAAILIEKLAIFAQEIEARNRIAARYSVKLGGFIQCPTVPEGTTSTWAQYTIVLPKSATRNVVQAKLQKDDIPTAIYYPIPMHAQTAYKHFPHDPSGMAVSDDLCHRVLSLPMHPYLEEAVQDQICASLIANVGTAATA